MNDTHLYDAYLALKNVEQYKNILPTSHLFNNNNLSELGLNILKNKYCSKDDGETTIEQCFSRVALAFADDYAMAQKIYKYMGDLFFIPATPIMANGGLLHRGIPISCYLNESGSSLEDKIKNINENIYISNNWGGIGTCIDGVHSQDVMVYCKMLESLNFAFYNDQRKSSAAVYLSINHGAIEEFLEMRRPVGGDHRTKCLNLNHGIIIPDAFFEALKNKQMWSLYENNGQWIKDVDPLALWNRIVKIRFETGEPYLLFSDRLKEAAPDYHKQQSMEPKTSNLCSEITLYTSTERTAVCCLGSLNLVYYDQWKDDDEIIEMALRFLDNVLNYTATFFNHLLPRATLSINMENAVGLGVMGFHSLLQQKNIAFDSPEAAALNEEIFSLLKEKALAVSKKLAQERGACRDAQVVGVNDSRFSYMLAIAPTATISYVGGCSPGIEPYISNIMTIKNGMGNYNYLNENLLKVLNGNENFKNNPDFREKVIKSISKNNGSINHLDFLDESVKNSFKTAFEIDQMALVKMAADRQKYICQAQSLNLFFRADKTIGDLSKVLIKGFQWGAKTFYYSRTQSILRAEGVEDDIDLKQLNENYKQSFQGGALDGYGHSGGDNYTNEIICEGCV
jgi:ribonucleoside-diphosphate reductase alpha chain